MCITNIDLGLFFQIVLMFGLALSLSACIFIAVITITLRGLENIL